MNSEDTRPKKPFEKDKKGNVKLRKEEQDQVRKGAQQEDQLDKLKQGEKTHEDDSGNPPIDRTHHGAERDPNEP